jgi:two-component system sensor histidine kinase KdpD
MVLEMRTHTPSLHFMRYVFVIFIIASVTVIFFFERESLDKTIETLIYLLLVGLITTLWGLGPGITSAFIAFLTFNFFLIQPYYTLAVHQIIDLVILMVFLIVAVVISQLVGRARAGMDAATAREREATQLYELSTNLAGLHDDQTIGNILAEQIQTVFRGDRLELELGSAQPHLISLPLPARNPDRPPELIIPIQAARESVGEIRLWRATPSPTPEERRLLYTFASQGALALERARLAQTESRARVLEESDRLKSAILSSVSHDLRTPLATIKASVSSLRSGDVHWDSTARPELLAAIDEETDHLNMVVGNLLDMSRLEAGALHPRREWNILSEIVGGVLERMRHQTKNHTIEVDIPDELPLLPVDYIQMEQVFTNLLSNSIKYSPLGTRICIYAQVQNENTLLVQVSNQGPHVPEEDLERIFDKFYRITAADRVTGTGLGLSICKGIIEAHGGRIWAENRPEEFVFNFLLPLTWNGIGPLQLPLEPEEG